MPLVLYVIALKRKPEIGKNLVWISNNNLRLGQIIKPRASALYKCLLKLRDAGSLALQGSSYLGKKQLGSIADTFSSAKEQ